MAKSARRGTQPTPRAVESDEESAKLQAEIAKQYDLPSSRYDPELDSEEGPIVAKPAAPAIPRNTDGTFKPKTYDHSGLLLKAALDAGLTRDQAIETPPEDLRLHIQLARSDRSVPVARVNPEAVPETPRPPTPAELDWLTDENGQKLTEAAYDPLMAKLYKEFHEFKAQIAGRLGDVENFARGQSLNQTLSKFDKMFAKQKDIYGDGATDDLPADSPLRKRRDAVLKFISMKLNAKQGTTAEKDWAEAHELLSGGFGAIPASAATDEGDEIETPPARPGTVRRPDARTAAQRFEEGGALPAPTSREDPPMPKGEERATHAVANLLRKKNAQSSDFDALGDRHEANLPG